MGFTNHKDSTMNFTFTDEQKKLIADVRLFIKQEATPELLR
jgi:hypothetical protein